MIERNGIQRMIFGRKLSRIKMSREEQMSIEGIDRKGDGITEERTLQGIRSSTVSIATSQVTIKRIARTHLTAIAAGRMVTKAQCVQRRRDFEFVDLDFLAKVFIVLGFPAKINPRRG